MPTVRTPLRRDFRRRITHSVLTAFRRMEDLEDECVCPERDWAGKYWEFQACAACDEWWGHHRQLHADLGLPLWQWPAYGAPDADLYLLLRQVLDELEASEDERMGLPERVI